METSNPVREHRSVTKPRLYPPTEISNPPQEPVHVMPAMTTSATGRDDPKSIRHQGSFCGTVQAHVKGFPSTACSASLPGLVNDWVAG